MKGTFLMAGILGIALVFGMTATGCDNGSTSPAPTKLEGTWVKDSAPGTGNRIIFSGNTITFPDTTPSPVTGTFTFTDTEITGTNSSGSTMTFSYVLNGNSLTLSGFPTGLTDYNGAWTRQ